MGIDFKNGKKDAPMRLHEVKDADTFMVLNGGKPYTNLVREDDVYLKVAKRNDDKGHCLINLRTGMLHNWSGKLEVILIDVEAYVNKRNKC